jgi:hypothetical protein
MTVTVILLRTGLSGITMEVLVLERRGKYHFQYLGPVFSGETPTVPVHRFSLQARGRVTGCSAGRPTGGDRTKRR